MDPINRPRYSSAGRPAGGPAGVDILDRATLEELRDAVGSEVVTELVETYLQDAPNQHQAVVAAVDNQSPQALSRAAHRLKGSSMSLGLLQVRNLCGRLEELGRGGTIGEAPALLQELNQAMERAVSALRGELT